MGPWPVIEDLIGFCFFTIYSSRNVPSRRLNNNRNTSALVQNRGKTPPSNVNPPSLLIWAEGNHILRPREPSDHPSPSHYTPRFPCFLSVSSSGSFPKYVPWFWWPLPWSHDYVSIFFLSVYRSVKVFFFNFEVQCALAELMSWTPAVKRTAGLYITDEVVFTQLP